MSSEIIRVRRGETFEVELAEPPATGHRWRLTDAPVQVTPLGEPRYEPPPSGGPTGSAGRWVAALRATEAGRYSLRFELARPDEKQVADEYSVEVEAF
jgi:predicted secreted protein